MAIEAVAAVAAKEVAVQAAREAVTQAAREIAQKMAPEAGAHGAGNELQTAMMERQTMQEGFRLGEMPESKGEGREFLKQKETDAADELRGKLDTEEVPLEPESPEIQNPAESEASKAGVAQEAAETQEAVESVEDSEAQKGAGTAEQVEGQEALRNAIKEEMGWSDEIIDSIRNEGEYNVYKNADLKEGTVNGKQSLQQQEIDLSYKDDFGRTNAERMGNGLSPYDAKSGEKLELHHMGQRADSPFAELRENIDHGDGNHRILHDFKAESWRHEPGELSNYAAQKPEYWKARLEQLLAA